MQKLKIGVFGCGKITQVRHAPEYAENSACELTAWYDFLPERAARMARQYGGVAYQSVEEVLESGVDAVSVCVANNAHAQVSIQALDAGKDVLCEKPMAITLDSCLQMVEAARRNHKMLVIGHNQRLAGAHQKARAMIEAGAIGGPLTFHTVFGHPGPEGWTEQADSWFFHKEQAAFGALADLGAHKIDLIHYLLDQPITEVTAYLETLDKRLPDGTPISVDDNAMCLLRTAGGIMGTLHASWTFYGPEDNSTVIYGSEGVLRCFEDPAYSLIWQRKNGEVQRYALDPMLTNEEQTEGRRRNTGVINDFVTAVRTGKPSINDARQALLGMRVIFAALASQAQRATVHVDQEG